MKCPVCNKEVYFAERIGSLGRDWHRQCLKCERCFRPIVPGSLCTRDGKIYCDKPCYRTLYGPRGYGAVPNSENFS
ncbi:Cysteine-rich protein 1 [Schistosoma japonicum]|nr:Cysteine-rich protein 1 [Schistosoma japonicum]KAH8866033.1 Cysteine-rich protein 1 [Schistosoma japonicum]